MPVYLDERGEPIRESTPPPGKVYLDENGEPIGAAKPAPTTRKAGEMPYYSVPLPDPGVVAATAPIALAPAGIGMGPAAAKLLGKPLVQGAIGAAAGGYHGGWSEAALGGITGVLGGPTLRGVGGLLQRAGRLLQPAAKAVPAVSAAVEATPAARAATEAAVRDAATVSPTLPPNVTFSVGRAIPAAEAVTKAVAPAAKAIPATIAGEKILLVVDSAGNPLRTFTNTAQAVNYAHSVKRTTKLATAVIETAPIVAKAATPSATVARQAALVQFVKDVAQRNPKLGEKIWVALDDTGNPVRILTPDQAGAAKRAGQATTWVRNLWR